MDFFIRKDIQVREVKGKNIQGRECIWKVVDPKQLISFYKTIHSSDNCFAVKAAASLIEQGIDPIGMKSLVEIPGEELRDILLKKENKHKLAEYFQKLPKKFTDLFK